MLMKDDKQKMATIIVKKMQDKERHGDEYKMKPQNMGAEVHDADELYMMADDIMKSLQDGDVRSLKKSLEAFIQACSESHPERKKMDDSDY